MSRGDIFGGVADVGRGIFSDIAVVGHAGRAVVIVLADLAGAEQQQWDGRVQCAWISSVICGSQRRLRLFRSGSIPPDRIASIVGPGRDVLPQLHGIDLVQRVVGRVVDIEVARAVLVE